MAGDGCGAASEEIQLPGRAWSWRCAARLEVRLAEPVRRRWRHGEARDVVVLDVMLPGVAAWDLARRFGATDVGIC